MIRVQLSVLLISLLSAISNLSCDNKKIVSADQAEAPTLLQDTLQKNQIDSIVSRINEAAQNQGHPNKIHFPAYNPNDTLKYWALDGRPARISVNMEFPDKMVWPTFFVREGEPVLFRYRFWSKINPQYVMENLAYLNDGQIVYCTGRKMDLKEGEMPVLLRDREFGSCTLTPAEMKRDFELYWTTVSEFLKNN